MAEHLSYFGKGRPRDPAGAHDRFGMPRGNKKESLEVKIWNTVSSPNTGTIGVSVQKGLAYVNRRN
jgi:hypothetical protein